MQQQRRSVKLTVLTETVAFDLDRARGTIEEQTADELVAELWNLPARTPLGDHLRTYNEHFRKAFPVVMRDQGIKSPADPRWQWWHERMYRPFLTAAAQRRTA